MKPRKLNIEAPQVDSKSQPSNKSDGDSGVLESKLGVNLGTDLESETEVVYKPRVQTIIDVNDTYYVEFVRFECHGCGQSMRMQRMHLSGSAEMRCGCGSYLVEIKNDTDQGVLSGSIFDD